jgi:hypothetical protein
MSLPVTVFNASFLALIVSVNRGAPFPLPAGTPTRPGRAHTGAPGWGTAPDRNIFGVGTNKLFVMTLDPQPVTFTVEFPAITWISVQLYVLLDGGRSLAVALLNHGKLVSITRTQRLGRRRARGLPSREPTDRESAPSA